MAPVRASRRGECNPDVTVSLPADDSAVTPPHGSIVHDCVAAFGWPIDRAAAEAVRQTVPVHGLATVSVLPGVGAAHDIA
jgi:hypothetical protein